MTHGRNYENKWGVHNRACNYLQNRVLTQSRCSNLTQLDSIAPAGMGLHTGSGLGYSVRPRCISNNFGDASQSSRGFPTS